VAEREWKRERTEGRSLDMAVEGDEPWVYMSRRLMTDEDDK
jgi:hypothetical protein